MSSFLEIKALRYGWPGMAPALREAEFHLERGQRLCVCGCNGGGKSTLLQLLSGILSPCSGEIRMNGIRMDADPLRMRTALLMQDADMQIIGATAGEDLLLNWPEPDHARITAVRALASRFDLLDCWERPVHALSYGQKRKLCLCSALLAGTVVVGVGLVSAAASILGHYLGAGLAIKNGSRIVRPTVILVLVLLLVKVVSELLFPEFWS